MAKRIKPIPAVLQELCAYGMKINLASSHLIQISIGGIISLLLLLSSLKNFEYNQSLSVGRLIPGCLVLLFSLTHFYNLKKHGATLTQTLAFSPVVIAFLYTFTLTWIGYSTDWAPATREEALMESVKSFSLTGLIILLGLASIIHNRK